MAEEHYQGGCHCNTLRYEVDLDLENGTIRCNCSLCSKARAWFAFAPFEKFRMTRGTRRMSSATAGRRPTGRSPSHLPHLLNLRRAHPCRRHGPQGRSDRQARR